ncbi:MAG: T9SS C-terminal target domain-containing protein [Bacteroidetes bacterium]|nr:MAG: T9SS C-terminal target domain-containing protein [Bacteroidota bacterium]
MPVPSFTFIRFKTFIMMRHLSTLHLLALAMVLALTGSIYGQSNLIVDGDFESGVKAPEWTGWNWDVDTVDAYSGTYAAKTAFNYNGDAGVNYEFMLPDTNLYHFGAYVKFRPENNPERFSRFRIQYKVNGGAWTILWEHFITVADSQWTYVDTMFTMPDSTTAMRVNMYQNAQGGTFFLDSVFLMLADTTSADTSGNDTSTTAIQILNDLEVQVFPNPAQGQLTIRHEAVQPVMVTLTDLSGRMVLRKQVAVKEDVLPVADLPRGLYLMAVRQRDGTPIYRQKVLLD